MKSENNTSDTAEERAAKIDALAKAIIDDAVRREDERRQSNADNWTRFLQRLERGTP